MQVLQSARANATNNHGMTGDRLYVGEQALVQPCMPCLACRQLRLRTCCRSGVCGTGPAPEAHQTAWQGSRRQDAEVSSAPHRTPMPWRVGAQHAPGAALWLRLTWRRWCCARGWCSGESRLAGPSWSVFSIRPPGTPSAQLRLWCPASQSKGGSSSQLLTPLIM